LKNDFIRLLSYDEFEEITKLDMRGDFDKQIELTRKFCNALLDAGIYEFNIHHSFWGD